MNTTGVTTTPQPPATQSEQHSLPEPTTTPLDEPQSPAMSHQEQEGAVAETVLQIESNEQVSDGSKATDTAEERRKGGSETMPREKVVAFVAAGVLSLFSIAMAYAASLSYSVRSHPTGPLAVSVTLTVFNLVAFSWICTEKYRVTTTGALLPIFFSLIGGLMSILFFAVIEAAMHMTFIHVNEIAVIVSLAVFGGIGLGANIGYFAFAKNAPSPYGLPVCRTQC